MKITVIGAGYVGLVTGVSLASAGRHDVTFVERNPDTFRIVGPDETASNRLQAVVEATDRQFLGIITENDEHVAPAGRVIEVVTGKSINAAMRLRCAGVSLLATSSSALCMSACIALDTSRVRENAAAAACAS